MKQYLEMCKYVLENGEDRSDRTGTGTRSVFGYQTRYDLRDGFPLMTTKKMFIRPIAEELLWFIKGDTNIKYLVDRNVKIWNEWPYENYKKSKDYQGETIEEFIEKIKNLPEDDSFVLKYGDLGPVYGAPFNIASYALMVEMLARTCGYEAKEFVHTIGDAHIYKDHFDVVKQQLERKPLPKCKLVLNPEVKSIFDYKIEDIKIEDYQSYGKLVGKVSV